MAILKINEPELIRALVVQCNHCGHEETLTATVESAAITEIHNMGWRKVETHYEVYPCCCPRCVESFEQEET